MRHPKRRILWVSVLIASLIILVGAGVYFWQKVYNSPERKVDRVVSRVSKIMQLPEGSPTMFVIEDPSKAIVAQPFFKGTEKGDILLIYAQSSRAVVYSPSRNIIVNSGPVSFQSNPESITAPVASPQASVPVASPTASAATR